MKQYYESEVLFQLMERDGLNIPSSVPPYEAEIKAYLINQVKQAYPKLTDYEAEWLLYNYTKHLPAEFPISSVSGVTKASFENVVPFAYQSAILKGHTLVNLSTFKNNSVTQSASSGYISISDITQIKPSTDYTFIYYVTLSNITSVGKNIETVDYLDSYFPRLILTETQANGSYILKFKQTSKDDISNSKRLGLKFVTLSGTATIEKAIIIEGDYTNIDIPYFEGMQSIQMPVLTTIGKNLFDVRKYKYLEKGFSVSDDWIIIDNKHTGGITKWNVKLKPNTTYMTSCFKDNSTSDGSSARFEVLDKNGNKILSLGGFPRKFTTTEKIDYTIEISRTSSYNGMYTKFKVQIEENSTVTSYEPYETIILSTPSDLELRGIGDVKDELDLLTGEVVERVGTGELNGTESWTWKGYNTDISFVVKMTSPIKNIKSDSKLLLDKFNYEVGNGFSTITFREMDGTIGVYLPKNTIDDWENDWEKKLPEFLSKNNINFKYELATESVKTIELTTINKNGESVYFMPLEGTMHVSCNSQTIQPTFDMTVPVEATTQNLASFIDLEMEE